jgi:hypothetical protein
VAKRAQLAGIEPPAAFDALGPAEMIALRDLLRRLEPTSA